MNLDEYTKLYFEQRRYHQYVWVKNLTRKEWAEPGKYDRQLKEYIVQNMPIGVFLIGSSGKISMVNKHAARILGFSEEASGENRICRKRGYQYRNPCNA